MRECHLNSSLGRGSSARYPLEPTDKSGASGAGKGEHKHKNAKEAYQFTRAVSHPPLSREPWEGLLYRMHVDRSVMNFV